LTGHLYASKVATRLAQTLEVVQRDEVNVDQDEQPFGIGEAQVRSLLRRIARGDQAAREQLLEAYEPLVGSIARRYAAPGSVDYEDCCQEGRMALIAALRAFKPDQGASFGTYAKHWVAGAMKKDSSRAVAESLGLEADEVAEDSDEVQLVGEFVGGQQSGRDPYLLHGQREFDDVLGRFAEWLTQGGLPGEVNRRVWGHLCRAERELLVAVRQNEGGALAKLEQKYLQLCADFIPDERRHRSDELRLGPDARSAALAGLVAHAVEAGSLPERAWYAKLAEQGIRPQSGPGFVAVRQFRERALPGGLIAEAQVAAWIEAQLAREGEPAAAYLKVPLREDELFVLAEPDGDTREAYASLLRGLAQRLAAEPAGELPGAQPEPRLRLCYAAPDGELRLAQIRADGQLAALKAVATSLTAHFDLWSEDEAVAYVLSGYVPPLDKLRARTRRGLFRAASRITYDVDPRTSPAALAEFHTRLRKRWVEGRDRLLADKALAMAGYVECHWRPDVSWEELQRHWNEEHPAGELHSEVSVNQFATECRDAWERLTGEIWPQSVRAARKLRHDLDAARVRRKQRSLPDEQPPT
jgi:RNA polymerase sigma factor (sigma-70 family)